MVQLRDYAAGEEEEIGFKGLREEVGYRVAPVTKTAGLREVWVWRPSYIFTKQYYAHSQLLRGKMKLNRPIQLQDQLQKQLQQN